MPKEITHLVLADRVAEVLSATGVGACIHNNTEFYRYGSVMPDTPFYSSEKHGSFSLINTGMAIHGTPPGNTMAPYIRLAEDFDISRDNRLLSLICGALVHMITDSTFHPSVIYFSGSDLYRHYRFETLLDCHFAQISCSGTPRRISDILHSMDDQTECLIQWMLRFYGLPGQQKPVRSALKRHGTLQALFFKRWACYGYKVLTFLKRSKDTHNTALFYPPDLVCNSQFFNTGFKYRHPVTGQPFNTSIETLSEEVIAKAVSILSAINTEDTGGSLADLLSTLPPVSLETGLDSELSADRTYTDTSLSIDNLVLD